MPTPLLKRIYQLPSLTTPATQLAGGYLVWDVPLGPVAGGYKSYRGTAEELAAYLRGQGLLGSETAALVATNAATGVLIYEVAKNMSAADQGSLCLAVTTDAGIYPAFPTTQHLTMSQLGPGTYDSTTGLLYVTLPGTIAVVDVLSTHLYRSAAGVEQVLAADLNPFGSDSSQFLIGTYEIKSADLPEPKVTVADAVVFASVGIEGTGGSLNPLAYGAGYTSSGNVLSILTAANVQAGEVVHYSYLAGSVQASGVTPADLATAKTILPFSTHTADYKLQATDGGTVVRMSSTSQLGLAVPANSDVPLPIGWHVEIRQGGTGQVVLAGGANVVLNAFPLNGLKTAGRYAGLFLHKVDDNTWNVAGGVV